MYHDAHFQEIIDQQSTHFHIINTDQDIIYNICQNIFFQIIDPGDDRYPFDFFSDTRRICSDNAAEIISLIFFIKYFLNGGIQAGRFQNQKHLLSAADIIP